MLLYLRHRADHPPTLRAPVHAGDSYVVLCGNLVAGSIEPITSGPSAGL